MVNRVCYDNSGSIMLTGKVSIVIICTDHKNKQMSAVLVKVFVMVIVRIPRVI